MSFAAGAQHEVPSLPGNLTLARCCRTIYNMCTQKPPYDYSEQLYQRYREAFNNYINDKVGLSAVGYRRLSCAGCSEVVC